MRADYSINLDQYDDAMLKLGQATALLRMIRAAQDSDEFESMDVSERKDGLYAIVTLLEGANESLSGGAVLNGGGDE
jgi:hypothetical protein